MDNIYPKILIVEDEKGLRLGTEKLLLRKGYSVSTAENGKIGIEKKEHKTSGLGPFRKIDSY